MPAGLRGGLLWIDLRAQAAPDFPDLNLRVVNMRQIQSVSGPLRAARCGRPTASRTKPTHVA
jgi:hypothetical protein